MPRLSRIALVLLIAATLATTAALADPLGRAQPRRSTISASAPSDLAAQLWSFLVRIWSKNGSQAEPSGLPTKNGSQADPNGVPTKNGSMVEPDGLPTKNGHQVDPSGGSLQAPVFVTPNGDNGHQVDPDG
jgi:hypothetical protein